MLEKVEVDGARSSAAIGEEDARSAALILMSEALARLDSDSKIPAVIGAHLQTAIDALWTGGSTGTNSIHLH